MTTILPELVLVVLRAYAVPLFQWLSDQIWPNLLKRADDHFFMELHATLNFAPLETACTAFHHADGPGAPPTHPVPRLVCALLIGMGLLLLADQLIWISVWAQRNGWYLDAGPTGADIPTYFVAILTGLLSFLSPCVLPLAPAYLGYLGGRSVEQFA